ncbi:unnamed protein product [Soboliphyme baturini]|uniref:NADH dehydrogenase [ubiquinone] 1 beta subcomplex subunit 5, mitochondrial n=1 Tax=Soboliphyme baturini TaxID=241478 RepID=A0A183IFC2_9BILA|nr:unnamed protein product [Soboliphyme baturini]
MRPATLHWSRTKNLMHFHAFMGFGVLFTTMFVVNLIWGECELTDIPEGYEPHYWEYERHPLSQWFAKYYYTSPQRDHEKFLSKISFLNQKRLWALEEQRVKHLVFERGDYKAWYYVPVKAKWVEYENYRADRIRQNVEDFIHMM